MLLIFDRFPKVNTILVVVLLCCTFKQLIIKVRLVLWLCLPILLERWLNIIAIVVMLDWFIDIT